MSLNYLESGVIKPEYNLKMQSELEKIGWNILPENVKENILHCSFIKDFKDIKTCAVAVIENHMGYVEICSNYKNKDDYSIVFSGISQFIEIATKYGYEIESVNIYQDVEAQND